VLSSSRFPEDDFDDLGEVEPSSGIQLSNAVSVGSEFLISDAPSSPTAVVESYQHQWGDDTWMADDDVEAEFGSAFMSDTKFSKPDERDIASGDEEDDLVVLVGPGPVVEGFMPHAHYEETMKRTFNEAVPGSRAPLQFGDPARRRRASVELDDDGDSISTQSSHLNRTLRRKEMKPATACDRSVLPTRTSRTANKALRRASRR
jgi:hypothetical protein